MEKKLKIALGIVVIVLLSIISFAGVYVKDSVVFKSKLPDYAFGTEIGEKRISKLVVNTKTKEVIYDKDGKVVSSIPDGANEEEYRKEQEKINKDEAFTSENYKKVKEILEGRLKSLGIEDYIVRVNEDTGDVVTELEDKTDTDTILQYLLCNGDFSVSDSKDKTILLDKSYVKQAKVLYSRGQTNGVTVYLNIIFNSEGKEKLAQISKDYLKTEEDNTEDNKDNTDEANNTESNQKQVTLTIEGNDLLTTSFGEEMLNGELPISLGSASSNDTLQEYMKQGEFYAMLINNDTMPLEYEMGTTESTQGLITTQSVNFYILISGIIVLIVAITIFMICKFKLDGVFAGLSFVASASLCLLFIRYTGTQIFLNAIYAGFFLIIVDAYLVYKMLANIKNNSLYENVRKTTVKTYLENIEVIVISLILAIVFTFMNYSKAFSFGMTLFYGIISIGVSNMLFLRTMLLAKYNRD